MNNAQRLAIISHNAFTWNKNGRKITGWCELSSLPDGYESHIFRDAAFYLQAETGENILFTKNEGIYHDGEIIVWVYRPALLHEAPGMEIHLEND
jgi:hypothetical protein